MIGKRHAVVPASILVCALAVSAALIARDTGPPETLPELRFAAIDGRVFTADHLSGRPVLVNFWATSCGVCVEELPDIAALYRELGPRGLEIIGVAMPYDSPRRVVELVQRSGLPYPVVLDVRGDIVDAFGNVGATPTSFLIAPDGNVVMRVIGRLDTRTLGERVRRMLASPA